MLDSPKKKVVHPEFAQRMQIACDGNPNVPPLNKGRLGWFATELEKRFHAKTTIETVRKWFAGETLPRPKMMGYLAAVLQVDHAWLSVGSSPQISDKQKKVRDATADGAVNLVAGLIQICGGSPAFPEDGDERAKRRKIDLYAVIKGAQYSMHIAMAEEVPGGQLFAVPVETVGETFVLGVVRIGELSFKFFELASDLIEEVGKRKGGSFNITMPSEPDDTWKEITSFSNRL